MTRTMTSMLLVSLFAIGCGLINTKGGMNNGLTTAFTISDTTGRATQTFHPGEPFLLSFALINNTPDTFTAHFPSMPPIRFEILRGDSTLVFSNPKPTGPIIPIPNVIIEEMFLEPHDTVHTQWKAPDTPYENSSIILTDGYYIAQVIFPSYDMAILDTMKQLSFSIVQ